MGDENVGRFQDHNELFLVLVAQYLDGEVCHSVLARLERMP